MWNLFNRPWLSSLTKKPQNTHVNYKCVHMREKKKRIACENPIHIWKKETFFARVEKNVLKKKLRVRMFTFGKDVITWNDLLLTCDSRGFFCTLDFTHVWHYMWEKNNNRKRSRTHVGFLHAWKKNIYAFACAKNKPGSNKLICSHAFTRRYVVFAHFTPFFLVRVYFFQFPA